MSDLIPLEKALAFLVQDAKENASTVNVELRDAVGCMLTEEKACPN